MPAPVVSAIEDHIALESQVGGYEAADLRRQSVEDARAAVATLIGASPRNIAFMENATVAFNAALSAIPFAPGDVLLTTRADYTSNQIVYLSLAHRYGIQVLRAPDLPEGGVDPVAAAELVHRKRPRVVAVSHVPTNSGLVQQIAPLGSVCRERGIPFLVDACQSVGQLTIDVGDIECGFLSATARKYLRGPRGCGFLYVSDHALENGLEPLFIDMQGAHWVAEDLYQPVPDARRFENWEFAYALVLGLGAAARYALDLGVEEIEPRVKRLAAYTRDRLTNMSGITVLDRGSEQCGIVTVDVQGHSPTDVVTALRERAINTSASLWEYAVLDFSDKAVEGAVRISPHYYNTEAEIDAAVEVIRQLVT